MKNIDPSVLAEMKRLSSLILPLQEKLATQVADYNLQAKELYDEMVGNETDKHDKYVDELNSLIVETWKAMHAFYEAQPVHWQESEDGQRYQAWMESWEFEVDDFEIADFEELEEPTVHMEASDFPPNATMTEAPTGVNFPEDNENGEPAQYSMMRQKLLADWQRAVVAGETTVGLDQWIDTLPPQERAKYRPVNFQKLAAWQQHEIDKKLGLVDWKGDA